MLHVNGEARFTFTHLVTSPASFCYFFSFSFPCFLFLFFSLPFFSCIFFSLSFSWPFLCLRKNENLIQHIQFKGHLYLLVLCVKETLIFLLLKNRSSVLITFSWNFQPFYNFMVKRMICGYLRFLISCATTKFKKQFYFSNLLLDEIRNTNFV